MFTPVVARELTEKVCVSAIWAIVGVDDCSMPAIVPLKSNEVPPCVKESVPVQFVSGVNASDDVGEKPISTNPFEVYVLPDDVNVPSSKRLPSAN
jgi:hypothetical protein